MTSSDKNRPDKHFEQRARELWHEAAQRIDPATAGRLRAARRRALEKTAPTRHTVRWLIPTGAFAVIALAAMMIWHPLPRHTTTASGQMASMAEPGADLDSELPPDADKTDPNLYQDLDFYGWLAANNTGVSSQRTNR